MAITEIKTRGTPNSEYHEYTCDFDSDVANLPTNCCAGSSAFVIESGKLFMINSLGEWREI